MALVDEASILFWVSDEFQLQPKDWTADQSQAVLEARQRLGRPLDDDDLLQVLGLVVGTNDSDDSDCAPSLQLPAFPGHPEANECNGLAACDCPVSDKDECDVPVAVFEDGFDSRHFHGGSFQ